MRGRKSFYSYQEQTSSSMKMMKRLLKTKKVSKESGTWTQVYSSKEMFLQQSLVHLDVTSWWWILLLTYWKTIDVVEKLVSMSEQLLTDFQKTCH